ncbi:type II toxin-antitoxin system HicA family toxin [Candidatus Woesearchaeota archaeon]|nr:type II toxin-antitoxin system HicA family toxin [Candidatus Woesearchaeota archaeon]
MKLPLVSGKKMIKVLSLKGFQVVRQRSSHVQMKDSKGRFVTVPVHGEKPVSTGITLKILRGAEISREEFIELERKV